MLLRPITLPLALAVSGGALGLVSARLIITNAGVSWAPAAVFAALSCGWGYIACGLLVDRGRGMSRVGLLMVAQGFAWLVYWLKASPWAPASSVGLLVGQAIPVALFLHLLLAYPDGRVRSRAARVVVIAAYAITVGGNALLALIGSSADESCAACAPNALRIWYLPGLSHPLAILQFGVGTLVVSAAIAVLVSSYRSASPPRRRELRPMVWPGVVMLSLIVFAGVRWLPTTREASSPEASVYRIAMAMVALSFIVGLARERLHRRHVVAGAVARLSSTLQSGQLVATIREALDDPTVTLGYWSATVGGYLDVEGHNFALPEAGGSRSATIVRRRGHAVAAIVHDAALDSHVDAVMTIGNAAVLALENERLQADLRSTINRLTESEARFRELLEETPLLATIVALDGTVVFANRSLASVVGLPRDQIEGRHWAEAAGGQSSDEELNRSLGRLLPAYEGVIRDRHGRECIIAWTSAAISGSDGRVTHIASLGEDITARRRSEELAAQAQRERLELLNQLLRAEEAERARIAEALHDDTIQALTASMFMLDRIAGAATLERTHIVDAREMLAGVNERARRLMFELRPPLLEQAGLAAAVTQLCTQLGEDGGFVSTIKVTARRYARAIEDLCYRTVREAVLNTRRHACATTLHVVIDEAEGWLRCRLEDDGSGFDPIAVAERHDAHLHLGIYAMAERLRLAGGTIHIDSTPGCGTCIAFCIPAVE
jgi:PAS domain S-box-containing protein